MNTTRFYVTHDPAVTESCACYDPSRDEYTQDCDLCHGTGEIIVDPADMHAFETSVYNAQRMLDFIGLNDPFVQYWGDVKPEYLSMMRRAILHAQETHKTQYPKTELPFDALMRLVNFAYETGQDLKWAS